MNHQAVSEQVPRAGLLSAKKTVSLRRRTNLLSVAYGFRAASYRPSSHIQSLNLLVTVTPSSPIPARHRYEPSRHRYPHRYLLVTVNISSPLPSPNAVPRRRPSIRRATAETIGEFLKRENADLVCATDLAKKQLVGAWYCDMH